MILTLLLYCSDSITIIREQLNPVQCSAEEILSQLHICCKYIKDMLMNCKGEATPNRFLLSVSPRGEHLSAMDDRR
jgi:hypothetical protein